VVKSLSLDAYDQHVLRASNPVHEWGMIHREELLEAWRLCRENIPPAKIEPLA
jgi:hypothetical protein